MWSVAILCGSIVAACSGSIETPTEEFPPRTGGRQQAQAEGTGTPPRPQTQTGSTNNNNNNNASNNDDEDEDPPAASNNEDEPVEEDPPADEEDPPADEEDPPAAGDLSFEADIHPIFEANCGPCHAGAGSGGQDIGGPDLDSALEDAKDFEDRVIETIETGSMPLGCGGPPGSGGNCVSEEDFADIQAWYEAGAPE